MKNYYRQQDKQLQMQMSDKPVIPQDNKIYRVQNPIRSELSLSMFFLFKTYLTKNIEKVAKLHPQAKIIFGKVGGSWWKPEFRIIVGGKTKKVVEAAATALQNELNRGKKKS